jgi:hypothetical protein
MYIYNEAHALGFLMQTRSSEIPSQQKRTLAFYKQKNEKSPVRLFVLVCILYKIFLFFKTIVIVITILIGIIIV